MHEEIFDVVDERDVVIGQAPRREVHAKALWHRAVHVLVFDGDGRTFLQKRSMRKDMSPGCWDAACSGHVDSGEDYDTAARRELGEEIGLFVGAGELQRWFRLEACAQTGWEFLWVYRITHAGRLGHENTFLLNADEIERGGWFPIEEVTAWMKRKPAEFTPAFRLVWERVVAEKFSDGGGVPSPRGDVIS